LLSIIDFIFDLKVDILTGLVI